MRINGKFSATAMRRTADGVNRREYRTGVLCVYRDIIKEVKRYAKRGYGQVDFRSFCIHANFDTFHAFRLFSRKHPDFTIRWNMHFPRYMSDNDRILESAHCPYRESIERVEVTIKW